MLPGSSWRVVSQTVGTGWPLLEVFWPIEHVCMYQRWLLAERNHSDWLFGCANRCKKHKRKKKGRVPLSLSL